MTGNTASLSELEYLENIYAAAAYRQSNTRAYLAGYHDAENHICNMRRIDVDPEYTAGYTKQAQDEQKRAEYDLMERYYDFQLEVEQDEVWQQRFGWQL
jgi:hypothetical protein